MLLFKSTEEVKSIIFDRDNLFMPEVFLKEKVVVLEPNNTIDVSSLYVWRGFYIPLEDDEYIILDLAFSDLRILINRTGTFNGKGRYTITKVNGENSIYVDDLNSHDYLIHKYFEDGDVCRVNELDLFFGGIGEAWTKFR